MLKIGEALQMEYPQDLISECRKNRNQICRKRTAGMMLKAAGTAPTLLELENPEPYQFYDIFEVNDFSYSKEKQKGHLRAELSLLNSCKNLEIYAHILDLKNGQVIAQVPAKHGKNTNDLILDQEFTAKKEVAENMGVIAYGKWGNNFPEENELTVYKEVNTSYPGVRYMHKYPKKEKETVIFETLEGWHPLEFAEKGDDDHIIIALIRSPKNTNDVDYICGAGRDKRTGYPIVCVPGEGTFSFPAGEKPESSEECPNYAVCKLYRKSGGATVIASSDNPAYSTNAIAIIPSGNGYTYQFLAWGMGYSDPANWKKTEFDYRLELTLNTVKADGTWKTREFYIDTRKRDSSITEEVLPLAIMYGCMAPETEITMADGSRKQICRMNIGDMVEGRNGEGMKVTNIWKGPEMDSMLYIQAEGLQEGIFLTKSHPVLTKEPDGTEKWKRAGTCKVGDKVWVKVSRGEEAYHAIIEITEKEPCEEVYNLDLQPVNGKTEGTMYCNGILTGDNRMQNSDLEE
ncbi:MAG: hypothetical protein K2J99_10195 [Lachnospiraceae bacterium]|nr:hypothetical protein [Lachnospiraceae bacterium]